MGSVLRRSIALIVSFRTTVREWGAELFCAEFLHLDMTGFGHCYAASIVHGPGGGLLAAWYVYPDEETRDGRIVIARRNSESESWSRAKPVEFGTSFFVGNPVIFDDPEGALWLHYGLLRGLYWDSSVWCAVRCNEAGATLSRPSVVCDVSGTMIRHRPVFLPDGLAIILVYSDRTKRSLLYRSRPPYEDWLPHHEFDDWPLIQPDLFVVGEKLILVFRPSGESRESWRSISSDGGRTWSTPVRLPLPNPLSGVAAFELNGRIGVVYDNTREHQRYPLSVSWSDSAMHDWSLPFDFEAAQIEVSYPSFCVDHHGRAHGVYTYNRKLIKYMSFDEAWITDANARD